MSMKLDEIIDPIAIPPTPVAKANRSKDLIKLSVWLLNSLVGHLNQHHGGWRQHPKLTKVLLSVNDWKKYFPQGFPELNSDVWQLFSRNDLVVGTRTLDPNWDAAYDADNKMVIMNSQNLYKLIQTNNTITNKAVRSMLHELKHAYDDLRSQGQGLTDIVTKDYKKYLANPDEIRARFQEMESALIQELYFPDGSAKDSSYFRVIVPHLLQTHQLSMSHLVKHPQATQTYQGLIRQAHLLKQSFDKLSQQQRATLIQQLKQAKQMGSALTWWQKIKSKLNIA